MGLVFKLRRISAMQAVIIGILLLIMLLLVGGSTLSELSQNNSSVEIDNFNRMQTPKSRIDVNITYRKQIFNFIENNLLYVILISFAVFMAICMCIYYWIIKKLKEMEKTKREKNNSYC